MIRAKGFGKAALLSCLLGAPAALADDQRQHQKTTQQQRGKYQQQGQAQQGKYQPQGQAQQGTTAQGQPQQGAAQQGQPQQGHPQGTAQANGNRITMERATQLSQQALVHVTAAEAALERKDQAAAKTALDAAATSLRTLYDGAPAGKLLRELGDDTSLDVAPILSELRASHVYIDPSIAAKVEDANKKTKAGDRAAAAQDLRLARSMLIADLALLPVEEAYSRVLAARAELRDGDRDRALRLLQNVPVVIQSVTTTAPLVPVRFDLRAAAEAAEAGNWEQAGQLIEQAKTQLESATAMPGAPNMQKELATVLKKVRDLDRRIDAGKKPRPSEMRDLAKQTRPAMRTM